MREFVTTNHSELCLNWIVQGIFQSALLTKSFHLS